MDLLGLLNVILCLLQVVLGVLKISLDVVKHLTLRLYQNLHLLEELDELVDRFLQAQDRLKLVLNLLDGLLHLLRGRSHHLLHHELGRRFRVFFHLI